MSVSYRWNDHKDSNDQDPQAYIENQGICRLKHPTGAQQEIHHKGGDRSRTHPINHCMTPDALGTSELRWPKEQERKRGARPTGERSPLGNLVAGWSWPNNPKQSTGPSYSSLASLTRSYMNNGELPQTGVGGGHLCDDESEFSLLVAYPNQLLRLI